MICVEILQRYGFVPIVPSARKSLGTPQSQAQSRVPVVPAVPKKKHQGEAAPRGPEYRPVLQFRLVNTVPNAWATCIGRPGETAYSLRADLIGRFGDHLMETRAFNGLSRSR